MEGTKKVKFIFIVGILPGIAHLYLGRKKKGVALFIAFSGLILGFLLSDLILIKALMIMVYCSITVSAWLETCQIAGYGKNKIDTDAKWYTVVLLLVGGFAALPLLWQNDKFSKNSKILWTIAVPVLAIVFFTVIIKYRSVIETFLEKIFA
jgi:hypothetical protein